MSESDYVFVRLPRRSAQTLFDRAPTSPPHEHQRDLYGALRDALGSTDLPPTKTPRADESTRGRDTDTTPPDTTSSTAAGQKEKTNGRDTGYRP